MIFKFKDKVKVKKGFYESLVGTLIGINEEGVSGVKYDIEVLEKPSKSLPITRLVIQEYEFNIEKI